MLTNRAKFTVEQITDMFVLIRDLDVPDCPSVTNDAHRVVESIHKDVADLRLRRVYYRDSTGRFDELMHICGQFKGFSPCSQSQQETLANYVKS